MDACLWLLQNGVNADAIRWIMPRDAWMLPREFAQNSVEFFADTFGNQAKQFEALAAAENIDDMYDRLEAAGCMVRIDPEVRPTMFHAATISRPELEALRRIKNIIRMGRVSALSLIKSFLMRVHCRPAPILCMSIVRPACRAPCQKCRPSRYLTAMSSPRNRAQFYAGFQRVDDCLCRSAL